MRMLNRSQLTAVAALCLLLFACTVSVALSLEARLQAAAEQADRQDVLARLQARVHARNERPGASGPAVAPAEAFLDAPTAGLAGAELEAYVARLANQHAVLVSFGTQSQAGEEAGDTVRIEANLEVGLGALQVLLHQLETATPYVFVDSMTVRTVAANGGVGNAPLRVTLGLRALWRRRAA